MEDIERAADILLTGGTVIFPTDTVYGLGANALDNNAVEKIYKIKGRDKKKPINVLIADYEDILKVAEIPTREEGKLMEKFWPGSLTIILKRKAGVAETAAAGGETIGIRMPKNELARNLIREVGFPIATTSANLSGDEAGTNLDNIEKEVLEQVDFVLEGEEDSSDVASTIVEFKDGKPVILRKGEIKLAEIEAVLSK
ncbi:threonylcarbamoyl-AMP synthase [Candidatus Saccharibacteria bacterium]|nr:threonylcarbamoyl-AMP synthase [Candidatus Saccharibacteria bacterium]